MPTHIKDSVHQSFGRIKALHTRQNNSGGSTGFESLDAVLGGVHDGDLIVLAGFHDNYKTSLILQILIHNLLVEPKLTLLVSPVLSSLQITNRLIALTADIPLDKISGGTVEDHDWSRLTRSLGMLENSKLIISDRSDSKEANGDFLSNLRDIIVRDKVEFVFIDPMPVTDKEEADDNIHALKELSRDLGITIFLVIDIPVPAVKESRPSYHHLKPYGDIGGKADALCFVYKETLSDPLNLGDDEVETIVLTNYGRSCRLFIDESTGVLLEEKDYKSRQIDLVEKGS